MRIAEIDAQITTEEELEEKLRALDAIGTAEAKRLQEVLKIIWEWRQRRAKGRKIRRVADLKAGILKKQSRCNQASKNYKMRGLNIRENFGKEDEINAEHKTTH